MAPHILNYGRAGKGPRLLPGMALAIEPMVTLGSRATQELEDGWTVATVDGSWAAHWEHTVAILDDGPWVLTAVDGGRAELEARGIPLSAARCLSSGPQCLLTGQFWVDWPVVAAQSRPKCPVAGGTAELA